VQGDQCSRIVGSVLNRMEIMAGAWRCVAIGRGSRGPGEQNVPPRDGSQKNKPHRRGCLSNSSALAGRRTFSRMHTRKGPPSFKHSTLSFVSAGIKSASASWRQLNKDYAKKDLMVVASSTARIFTADIMRQMRVPLRLDACALQLPPPARGPSAKPSIVSTDERWM